MLVWRITLTRRSKDILSRPHLRHHHSSVLSSRASSEEVIYSALLYQGNVACVYANSKCLSKPRTFRNVAMATHCVSYPKTTRIYSHPNTFRVRPVSHETDVVLRHKSGRGEEGGGVHLERPPASSMLDLIEGTIRACQGRPHVAHSTHQMQTTCQIDTRYFTARGNP